MNTIVRQLASALFILTAMGGVSAQQSSFNFYGVPSLPNGQVFVGDPQNLAVPRALSGDLSMDYAGVATVAKTNGAAFGPFATGTNAANLTGIVAPGQIAGAYPGIGGVGPLSSGSLAPGFTPIDNALIANPGMTINGVTCVLGSACAVPLATGLADGVFPYSSAGALAASVNKYNPATGVTTFSPFAPNGRTGGGFLINFNPNIDPSTQWGIPHGHSLHLYGADNDFAAIYMHGFGTNADRGVYGPIQNFYAARGTASAPLATKQWDEIYRGSARGYTGNASTASIASLSFLSAEDTTASAQGGLVAFRATQIGSVGGGTFADPPIVGGFQAGLRVGQQSYVLNNANDRGVGWGNFENGVVAASYVLSSGAINPQTGTAYTLQASDNGKIVTLDNASPITLTVPAGLGAAFSCIVVQIGAGQATVTPAGSAVNSDGAKRKTVRYTNASLVAVVADSFILAGTLQ